VDAHEEASVHDAPVVRNIAGATVANEPLDPDVVAARAFVTEVGVAALTGGKTSVPLQALVALVEEVVEERENYRIAMGNAATEARIAVIDRDALAKQANEMEERAERNAVLHAEVMRERDFLLKPHNSDGTITCPECHKSMGGDGLVEALRGVMEERDLLRDKWNQMEAYGFGSPSQVFARLEAAEKAQKDAEERLKEAHVMDCSCGVVSLRGHPVDPDCAALRTRTETKA
jgi:hypothetical protein